VFKIEVEAATNSAVRIDLHFSGALGTPAASLESMMSGDLDLLSGDLRVFLPLMIDEVTGLDLLFMIPDNGAARRYLATAMFDEARGKVVDSRRIRFLELSAFRGPERMLASVRAVASIEDLRGMKLAIFRAPTKAGGELWEATSPTSHGTTYILPCGSTVSTA
jgi:TRAP-type C4-dicarboxylate transport system substrate-binding protein